MPMPSHDSEMDVEIADNEMVENDVIEARDAKMTIDQYVLDALSRNDDALVVQALAHYAQIPANAVSKILDSGSARAITALAWSAGMTAPAAVVLQISNGIPESAIESPAAGGRFAMAAADMDWYIDFFSDMKPVVSRAKVEKDSEPAPAQRQKVRSTIRNPERGFGPRSRSGRNSGGLEGLVSDRRSKGREED
jgi:hypothetical protein